MPDHRAKLLQINVVSHANTQILAYSYDFENQLDCDLLRKSQLRGIQTGGKCEGCTSNKYRLF